MFRCERVQVQMSGRESTLDERLRSRGWRRATAGLLAATAILVSGCSLVPSSTTTEPSASWTPPEAIDLVGPAAEITSGEPFLFVAQTRPPLPGVTVVLQSFGDSGWSDVTTATTDAQGAAALNLAAPEAPGKSQFRAVAQGPDGLAVATSATAIVAIGLAPTEGVVVDWPAEPLDYCKKAKVTVIGARSDAGRIVELQARTQGTAAETVDLTQMDDAGGIELTIPACGRSESLFSQPTKWRVVLPATENRTAFSTSWKALKVGEPPITCPSPQGISIYADNPDYRDSYFEVTNPSDICSMSFTVTAELFCVWEGNDIDGFLIGRKTSTPYSVPPGDTLTFVTREVFSNSAALCQERIPSGSFGSLEFNLNSVTATATGFTSG